MSEPKIVSHEEWRAARIALLAKEKEITRARDRVLQETRELPYERVEKDYRFIGPEGEVGLIDLFGDQPQLFVHHMMWLDSDESCPSCSMFYDSLGRREHFEAANTAVVFVAEAPFASIERMRRRLGWEHPIYATVGSDFSDDYHSRIDRSRGVTEYNYRDMADAGFDGDLPAESTFLRHGDEVLHKYSAYARGLELVSNYFMVLDMTPLGRQEEEGVQAWVRHNDSYGVEHAHQHVHVHAH